MDFAVVSMELRRRRMLFFVAILFCLLISYATFIFLSEETMMLLTKEDGIFETCGAICYLLAAVLAFVIYFCRKQGNDLKFFKTRRNVFFLILGLLFFFAFGEEISWGQRAFSFVTPGFLAEINTQREMNIHNLNAFRTISVNRLFAFFWFGYCIVIPVLNETISRLSRYFKRINIPIVPLFISMLFLTNYVFSRVINLAVPTEMHHNLIEIKECNFGILFFGVILWFLYSLKGNSHYTTQCDVLGHNRDFMYDS